jgi:hypothetical protein
MRRVAWSVRSSIVGGTPSIRNAPLMVAGMAGRSLSPSTSHAAGRSKAALGGNRMQVWAPSLLMLELVRPKAPRSPVTR